MQEINSQFPLKKLKQDSMKVLDRQICMSINATKTTTW